MAQQLGPEPGDDAVGGAVRREVPGAVQRGTGQHGQGGDDDARHHGAERGMVQQGPADHVGQGDGLHDHEDGAQRPHGHGDDRDPPQAGDPGRQLGVDQAGAAGARGWCAHRLNDVSFTSTARPVRPSATASRAVSASSQVAAVRTPSGRSATIAVRTGTSPSAPP